MDRDEKYMRLALKQAKLAYDINEVPVGAVVVFENRIIGKGFNKRESTNSPLSHAEIEAIMEAANELGSWRLENCELFVTLEPCIMCSGAIIQSRIKRVVFGARDPKAGAVKSLYELLEDCRLNHRVIVEEGVMVDSCSEILTTFFREIRSGQKLKCKNGAKPLN